jgi:pSer/pThr/pTyr-binding forkhead associated (FHA) protein
MSDTQFFLKKVASGVEIPIAGKTTVGRSVESTLQLVEEGGQASRNHAEITVDEGAAFVEDLGSTNGTFVNGARIEARAKRKLATGDRVRFDTEEFVYRVAAPPAAVDPNKTQFRAPQPAKAEVKEAKTAVNEGKAPESWVDDPARNKTKFVDGAAKKAGEVGSGAASGAPLAPVDAPYLLFTSGNKSGSMFKLLITGTAPQVWGVGSDGDRDIVLDDAGVSAKHATLRGEGGTWLVTDDLSLNGTFVNDKKIIEAYLSDGDRIRFHPVECVLRLPAAAGSTPKAGKRGGKNLAIIVAIAFVATSIAIFVAYELFK